MAPNKLVQLINIPVTAALTDSQAQLDAVTDTREVIKTN